MLWVLFWSFGVFIFGWKIRLRREKALFEEKQRFFCFFKLKIKALELSWVIISVRRFFR